MKYTNEMKYEHFKYWNLLSNFLKKTALHYMNYSVS